MAIGTSVFGGSNRDPENFFSSTNLPNGRLLYTFGNDARVGALELSAIVAIGLKKVSRLEKGARHRKCKAPDFGKRGHLEKGVRHRKCKAPAGPSRLSVPDPFFQTRRAVPAFGA